MCIRDSVNPCGRTIKPGLDMNPFTGLRDDGTDPWTGKYVDEYDADSDNTINDDKSKTISIEEQIMKDNEHIDEHLVDDFTIQHIANHCSVFLAGYGMDCEVDMELSKATIQCVTKLEELQPHQFAQVFRAAKKTNPDILSYDQAMRDYNNLQDWLASALKEIKQLESKGVWTEVHKNEANGEQIIPCTWVFRYKRNPAGEIIKCKAQICLRGDLMVDNLDSCAPAVMWSTI